MQLLQFLTIHIFGRSSHILGRLQRCVWNVFIPGTLA